MKPEIDGGTTVKIASKRIWCLIAVAVISLPLIALGGYYYWFQAPLPFVPLALKAAQAPVGSSKVTVDYEIYNRGNLDLILGDPSTTCGCSVASINPRRVAAGSKAIVTVVGTVPHVGEQQVLIRIPINTRPARQITLALKMTGTAKVPYVASSSPVVSFGTVAAIGASEPLRIETRERENSPHWIVQAECKDPNIELIPDAGAPEELPLGAGVVMRRYRYHATLANLPKIGPFRADLVFRTATDSTPLITIPLHGSVAPPVAAAPARLFAEVARNEPPPKLNILFRAHELDVPFMVQVIEPLAFPIQVNKVKSGDDWARFEIAFERSITKSFEGKIHFKTNHPESAEIHVPIVYRIAAE